VWIRDQDGVPMVKFRFQGEGTNSQNFETDWNTVGEIHVKGRTGSFTMDFDQRDENTIAGQWNWDLVQGGTVRTDEAQFTMFRGGYGRQMIWRVETEPSPSKSGIKPGSGLLVWTFHKASRREILWSEIPF